MLKNNVDWNKTLGLRAHSYVRIAQDLYNHQL